MALFSTSIFPIKYYILPCLCLLFASKKSYGFEGRKVAQSQHLQDSHVIEVSSLFAATSCKPASQELKGESSLRVVHKYGACNHRQDTTITTIPDHAEILRQDQSRVNYIQSKLSKSSTRNDQKVTDAATLPTFDGRKIGSGNYVVTVGLGTPKKDLSLIFDTGSDITWTQCQPCVTSCYQQQDPIFDPSKSTSYLNISCTASLCNSLTSATGKAPGCSSSTCLYAIQYGDSSFSVGFFGKERMTLTSTDSFDIYFGCGQNNQGLFGGSAGLLGLGRDKLSLVSQTAQKYNKLFSYCLPSTSSSTGFLNFGGSPSSSVKFTPLSTSSAGSSFYGLDFIGINVAGRKLAISSSVFSTPGAIIDSGTVITRLPPAAYSALRFAFRQAMSTYPTAPALSILDTCYDFSSYKTVTVPKIAFLFNGGVVVDIHLSGIFYVNKATQVCLAFAGNNDATDVAILGNVQQKTLEVVYDGVGGRVGFAPGGCS
ncbi:hypothetical protein K2173_025834 [Erythroxylum novogranatense]|uniref:Peptidase A1 domain-containing protein n=1 Tax=Erythroxylum novogranatense TaxID=1862640 RepID=A0AAV8SHD5_9ROSI|nr:hypothetical protein K2173_025834 [Erythroxylum novogranatense]